MSGTGGSGLVVLSRLSHGDGMLMSDLLKTVGSCPQTLVVLSHPSLPWWRDPNNWVNLGIGIGTVAAAIFAYLAARTSKASADVSKESVKLAKDSAELLKIQYEEQRDLRRPRLKFGELNLVNTERQGGRTGRLDEPTPYILDGFNILIENQTGEYISKLTYCYVFYSHGNFIDIDIKHHDTLFSQSSSIKINEKIDNRTGAPYEHVYFFLFVHVNDATGLGRFSTYGERFEKEWCNGKSYPVPKNHEPKQKELTGILIDIWSDIFNMSIKHPRYPKRQQFIELLKCDKSFVNAYDNYSTCLLHQNQQNPSI
jgi:hypothetical protein